MNCKEFIRKEFCTDCIIAKLNENADFCIYRDEPEEQMKMEGLDEQIQKQKNNYRWNRI